MNWCVWEYFLMSNFYRTNLNHLWRNKSPRTLNQAVDVVWNVAANDIVRFLSTQAVIDGAKKNLEDFADVIGGN